MVEQVVQPEANRSSRRAYGHVFLWCAIGLYLVWFGSFAWHDLYASETIEGLYRTHHSPYQSAVGLVVDPQPNQSLREELAQRTGVTLKGDSDDWSTLSEMVKGQVVDTQLRPLARNELILARDAQSRPLLVVNNYRDNWVIFRANVGIILSTESTNALLRDVLVLKAAQ
jgi:hypothetical protein